MKQFLFILTVAICGVIEPSFAQESASVDVSTSGDGDDVIAFVGKKIFVRKDKNFPPKQDPTSKEITIYMNSRYNARYKILDLVAGEYEAEKINFHAYDHYGIPKFSTSKDAVLLFVHDRPKNYIHSKYNYYEVHRTTDGDWAACGNPYTQYDPDEIEKEPLEALSFIEPVTVTVPSLISTMDDFFDEDDDISDADRAEAQSEIDEEYKEVDGILRLPIWKRDGNTATCLMGTRVEDLFKFQNETRFMPDKRDDICHKRYNEELDALGNDYKAQRTLIDDCTALLKIQNLP